MTNIWSSQDNNESLQNTYSASGCIGSTVDKTNLIQTYISCVKTFCLHVALKML